MAREPGLGLASERRYTGMEQPHWHGLAPSRGQESDPSQGHATTCSAPGAPVSLNSPGHMHLLCPHTPGFPVCLSVCLPGTNSLFACLSVPMDCKLSGAGLSVHPCTWGHARHIADAQCMSVASARVRAAPQSRQRRAR